METEIIKLLVKLVVLTGEGLARLDVWWAPVFGRPLSGRINRIEIQTLFHGNTKDGGADLKVGVRRKINRPKRKKRRCKGGEPC